MSCAHPEETCHRCGGPNVDWAAPSPLWNAVMRGGSIDGPWEFNEIICPTCFCILAEERGVAVDWRVDARVINVPLVLVTPSGRRWDPLRWLWVDGETEDGMSKWVANGFPWPSVAQRRDAAQCIRDEYVRRNTQRREISQDLFGHTGAHIASVAEPTLEDLVNIVLWSLRGQRRPMAEVEA